MSTQPTPAAARHCKVAIIGTGFSGLGMAIRLRQEGEDDFLIFEKDAGVGGTWRVNNYPGCACDVQSHVYSFSFEANPEWTRMFARQPEIRAYLEKCWEKYRLQEKTLLNTEIGKLAWDERQSLWHLHDAQGNHYTANAVVSGMGGLSTPAYPRLDGLENFQGKVFHSQQWDHDYDLKGKRVAVIGTGASAIQFVPEIQPLVAALDLYQRTPPWILPKPDRAISETERRRFRRFPLVQKLWRGGLYSLLEGRVLGFTFAPQVMKLVQRLAIRHIHKQIKDPELRRKVTPDYTIGCKRILMSHNYYPALAAANSTVITEGIRAVTANGIVDGNGWEREVDAIIFGTGFTANDPIPRGVVFGRDDRDLLDSWTKGPEAYKGTTTAGFPNLFFLMGPNTGLGHNSMVYMIESQIAYVLDALKLMKRRELLSLEVKAPVQERYNEYLQRKLDRSVWSVGGCKSWYLHPVSVPQLHPVAGIHLALPCPDPAVRRLRLPPHHDTARRPEQRSPPTGRRGTRMKSFENKVAAITGAGSGIGRALAVELGRQGCHLALADVNAAALEETRQLLASSGVRVSTAVVDVADREQVQAWADKAASEHGRVNLIFNNAGVAHAGTVEGSDYSEYEWIMNINFWGVVNGTKAFLPHLKASGNGHVVNVSSVFGLFAQPGMSAYNATKYAVRGFTESLRQELDMEDSGVSASCVHPGGIRTNIAKTARMNESMAKVTGQAADKARQQFNDQLLRTTPEKAAQVILRGVQRDSRRILIGADAHAIDVMLRLAPVLYQRVVTASMRLAARFAPRPKSPQGAREASE